MSGNKILERVKQAVSEVDPYADVILYGSRARGTDVAASDWDILILTSTRPHPDVKKAIRRRLYEIEWDTGEVISPVIRGREEWNQPLFVHTPFHCNIEREGIRL